MTENEQPKEENLTEEFRNLGHNLAEAFRAAWQSTERQKLQNELEEGLTELTKTVKKEFDEFNESQTGQRFKADMENVRRQSEDVVGQTREELLKALRTVNAEIEKTTDRWKATETTTDNSEEQSAEEM